MAQLVSQVDSDKGLSPNIRQAIVRNNDGPVYWRPHASSGLKE